MTIYEYTIKIIIVNAIEDIMEVRQFSATVLLLHLLINASTLAINAKLVRAEHCQVLIL